MVIRLSQLNKLKKVPCSILFNHKQIKNTPLIFGNEVNGVSDEAMAQIDLCIEIPQFGTKHSFNIVISAGIVLWDFFAKLRL
jgi:23S rRNA (guanosine2251-2'-O)-methyltransferase